MTTTIETRDYRISHGRTPAAHTWGLWIFQAVAVDGVAAGTYVEVTGRYRDAAAQLDAGSYTVCP